MLLQVSYTKTYKLALDRGTKWGKYMFMLWDSNPKPLGHLNTDLQTELKRQLVLAITLSCTYTNSLQLYKGFNLNYLPKLYTDNLKVNWDRLCFNSTLWLCKYTNVMLVKKWYPHIFNQTSCVHSFWVFLC